MDTAQFARLMSRYLRSFSRHSVSSLASTGHPTSRNSKSTRGLAALAGTCTLVVLAGFERLQGISFPYDREYAALLQLMWSGTEQWLPLIGVVFAAIRAAALFSGIVALGAACWPLEAADRRTHTIRVRAAALATLAGIYVFSTHALGRLTANVVYSLRGATVPAVDLALLRLESGAIRQLQLALDSPFTRELASTVYSVGWLGALVVALPCALCLRSPRAKWLVALGPLLVTAAAVPIHVMLPVHDPWSFNPEYGFRVSVPTSVRYLFVQAEPDLLREVARSMRTVVGSCLPSLHVAFPAFMAAVFSTMRVRWLSAFYWVMTAVVAWSTVFLGRHWIVDAVAAVVLALIVERAMRRVPPRALPTLYD